MATTKKESLRQLVCLVFLLHFVFPAFSFHALLPKIHREIDRESVSHLSTATANEWGIFNRIELFDQQEEEEANHHNGQRVQL